MRGTFRSKPRITLLRCRTIEILPKQLYNLKYHLKHILFKSNTSRQKMDQHIKKLQKCILNNEITDINTQI